MENTVYYLPGMGGRLSTGLGQAILSHGFQVIGRETRGEFQKLSFQHKIDTIADDLKTHFWYNGSKVILNSFGAYLFWRISFFSFPTPDASFSWQGNYNVSNNRCRNKQ